jgi:hypothetical protein
LRRLIVPLLAISALAAVAAGCGGGSSSSSPGSIDGVRTTIDALGPVLGALELAHTEGCCVPGQMTSARKLYVTSVQNLSTSLGPLASQIVSLKLAPGAHAAQDSLAAGVLELADEARRVVDRIQRARVSDFPRLAGELDVTKSYAVKRMQTAFDELRAKGYDLGTFGTS